jgi:hypothetical protein
MTIFFKLANIVIGCGGAHLQSQLLGRKKDHRFDASLSQKQDKHKIVGGIAQVVECLSNMHDTLGSISSTAKIKTNQKTQKQ